MNWYAYVHDKPAVWVDPSGREPFVQLPTQGEGFYSYKPKQRANQWGTQRMIDCIKAVGQFWEWIGPELGYASGIGVGDISVKNGGPMPGHRSHRKGTDVDCLPMRCDTEKQGTEVGADEYNLGATQVLADLFSQLCDVDKMFFNDPCIQGVRFWTGHENRLQVRLR